MANAALSDETRITQAVDEVTQVLTAELAGDALDLPSFPEVAMRVRKALANPDIGLDDVVRMVSAEPSLAVRLLQLANSAALNPSGQRITTLRVAIARIGFNLARSATIAFAMSQMRRADAWRGLETRFRELWEQSATLAAVSHAVAKRARGVNADQALFAGMLHAVGRLFVLTRVSRHPVLLNSQAYHDLEHHWQARVTRALLTRWDVGADIIAAASDFASATEPRTGPADLRDVLFAARCIVDRPPGAMPEPHLFLSAPFQRLSFDPAACDEILHASATEVASLRAALID